MKMNNDLQEIYLDNNATMRPISGMVDKVVELMTSQYGNLSNVHRKGVSARKALSRAREHVASLVETSGEHVC